jgi:Zn-dependent membrane protease YugP
LGIAVFGAITFFQLVTLPVEYDASRRAKAQLSGLGLVNAREGGAVSQVLSAAALTYVAAMVNALMQFLYFLSLMQRGSRN